MLPWETLLSSPYFPEFHSADRKITNADITKSLTEWTSSKPGHLLKEVKHAIEEVEDLPGQSDIQPDVAVGWIVEYLDCFKNCKLPRWRQCIREVVSQLQSLSKGDWKTPESQRLMYNITIDLHSLKDNAMFFKSLQKMVFTGSLHCEACLVSLLALSTSYTYKDILEQLAVGRLGAVSLQPNPNVLWCIECWTYHRNIQTVLPDMSAVARGIRSIICIHRKRISQYSFSVYAADMAPGECCQPHEHSFWTEVEEGACDTADSPRINMESG